MKLKTLSLVAGMALAANMGFAQAAESDETAGVPDIFGAVATHEATLMTGNEMASTKGEWSYPSTPSGYYIFKVKSKKRGRHVKIVYKDGNGSTLIYKSWRHNPSYPSTWKHR